MAQMCTAPLAMQAKLSLFVGICKSSSLAGVTVALNELAVH
jgi:hypothetical protein